MMSHPTAWAESTRNGSGCQHDCQRDKLSILRRVLVVIFCTAVGHGIVFAFGLDQIAANAIRVVMTPEWRQAISWVLAGAFGLIGLAGWEIWHARIHQRVRHAHPDWDITVNDVLDYIVNDSKEIFAAPPTLPIHGIMVPAWGTQHQSALVRLNQRVASGELDVSGCREILPQPAAHRHEDIRRKIEVEYWQIAQLHPFSCFHFTTELPQTFINQNGEGHGPHPAYYNLMMNTNQVRRAFPRKSLHRRLWERWVLRKPQIRYHHTFGPIEP
jgi:hypothetical protein